MRISEAKDYPVAEDTESLVCEPQMELFSSNELESSSSFFSMSDKKKKFGQVFTPALLAKFMISLLKNEVKNEHSVLDPCIGPNTFLSLFDEMDCYPNLTGMEVDHTLLTSKIEAFYNKPNRRILLQSFLQHPLIEKYDFVIQNPPYVRQELLNGSYNSKELALENISNKISSLIPSQSNLYVYFLVKAILHLKENGVMVAVIYDSWLYSSFGKSLRNIFTQLGSIESIYHFKENAFQGVEVGATVIYFKRTSKINEKKDVIKYYSLNSIVDINESSKIAKLRPENISKSDFVDFNFNENSVIEFGNNFFTKLKNISDQAIQRGTSSVANGYFLHNVKRFKESIPLIKDVSKIESFAATSETSYLLSLGDSISKATQTYLDTVKSAIVEAGDKYKAVRDKILKGEKWYKVNLKKPGNFIFNYYLRNNIDFIFNEKLFYISDNFYILNVINNPLAQLAILNSSFSKAAVLAHSRSQGGGLRKVQLYEFNDVPVIDINAISNKAIKKLEKLGEQMKFVDRYSDSKNDFIKKIDHVLLFEYNQYTNANITFADLETELNKYAN
jgi:adenine-specific DNA-methyltransferase